MSDQQVGYRMQRGDYVLCTEGVPIGAPIRRVSLAFDRVSGALLKHGDPGMVDEWARDYRGSLEWCSPELNNFVILTGRVKLEELNACLSSPGAVLALWAKARAGALQEESLPA
jgi:hypothetical protein